MDNPYQAPASDDTARAPTASGDIEFVRRGQKLVIWAILLNILVPIVAIALGGVGRTTAILVQIGGLVAVAFAIYGLYCLGKGMRASILVGIVTVLCMFVPLLNLLVLLLINGSATRRLRAAGYKVGLLGASK